jgi:hypothetical protein
MSAPASRWASAEGAAGGLHKTGTAYLQKVFQKNRALLLEAGLGPYQDA